MSALMTATGIRSEDLLRVGATALEGGAETFAGVSIDSRTVKEGELFVAIRGPHFDGHDFVQAAFEKGAKGALVDREVPVCKGVYRVDDTTRALASLARDRRERLGTPIVAITGSTGKTTTKEMTAALLSPLGKVLKTEGNLNNQYGLPLTLLRLDPEHWAGVLELGMSAAGALRTLTMIARPNVAVITNVAPVHLEFFPSLDAIAEAKAEILEGLRAGGTAVLNGDDPKVRPFGGRVRGRVVLFGRDRAFEISAESWRGTALGMRFTLRIAGIAYDVALPLTGPHFMMNFLAAAGAAHALGVSPEAIVEQGESLKPSRHRGEVLRLGRGVMVLDDSYNSSPTAVESAVTALSLTGKGRKVAFLGDMLELGPSAGTLHHQTGARVAPRLNVLVGVGTLSQGFLEGALSVGLAASALYAFPTSADAAAALEGIVKEGDCVLVKGSRAMGMESIVEALKTRFGPADES